MAVIPVTLVPAEIYTASLIGSFRETTALTAHRPNRHGLDQASGWNEHVNGAGGEIACAKGLNLYWTPTVNTFKRGGDVGPYQVRTRSNHEYELLIRRDDFDAPVYVLVTGLIPQFVIRGWYFGGEAKRAEWLKAHGGRPPAYFVPQDMLHDPCLLRPTLPSLIRENPRPDPENPFPR